MRSLTVKDVAHEALGALGWIDGYSEPADDDDLPQFRVEILDSEPDDPETTIRVAFSEVDGPFRGPAQHYKISIAVEPVPAEPAAADS